MNKKCNEKICKTCGDFEVKVLEEFADAGLDIEKIAEYLDWKKVEDNKFGKIFISGEKFPRMKIVFSIEDFEKQKGSLLIFWMKSKTRYWSIVSVKKPVSVLFSEKQQIKKGKVVDQVKRVEIFSYGGASVILTNHEFYGFLAVKI